MADELCDNLYELERGKLIDTVPRVLDKGRFPIWVARFHRERAQRAENKPDWNSWGYCPGDLAVYPARTGNILHVIACSRDGLTEAGKLLLPQYKSEATIVNRGIGLSLDVYDQVAAMSEEQGVIRVKPADIEKYAGKDQASKDIPKNKLQRLLFRQSGSVPKQFVEDKEVMKQAIVHSFKPEYTTAMGIYFATPNADVPKLMAWGVYGRDGRSRAFANYNADDGNGRLPSIS